MKFSIVIGLFVLIASSVVSAFAPSTFGKKVSLTKILSEPEEAPEGLDLNLEEMFDMFDAADKEKGFDDTIKKVKGN